MNAPLTIAISAVFSIIIAGAVSVWMDSQRSMDFQEYHHQPLRQEVQTMQRRLDLTVELLGRIDRSCFKEGK